MARAQRQWTHIPVRVPARVSIFYHWRVRGILDFGSDSAMLTQRRLPGAPLGAWLVQTSLGRRKSMALSVTVTPSRTFRMASDACLLQLNGRHCGCNHRLHSD